MINTIFGIPILKIEMPNHAAIKEQFLPFLEDADNFATSEQWDCMCGTTHCISEKNDRFPWDGFYENVQGVLVQYLSELGVKPELFENLHGYAWANRYVQNEHQEIHSHTSSKNLVSCAYMLELSEEEHTGQFMFYNSSNAYFPSDIMNETHLQFDGKRHNPFLKEGDIIFFPSSLDHYVTYNKAGIRRATISANFGIN